MDDTAGAENAFELGFSCCQGQALEWQIDRQQQCTTTHGALLLHTATGHVTQTATVCALVTPLSPVGRQHLDVYPDVYVLTLGFPHGFGQHLVSARRTLDNLCCLDHVMHFLLIVF